jgi:hypothetical protein
MNFGASADLECQSLKEWNMTLERQQSCDINAANPLPFEKSDH